MNEISFTVYLMPKARQEPGSCVIGGHASVYKKTSQRDYERFLMIELDKHRPTLPFTGPLYLKLTVFLPIPKSHSDWWKEAAQKGIIRPITKPDWDNLGKVIGDCMERKGFFGNDSQIVSVFFNKYYSLNPRWEISLQEKPQIKSAKEYKEWLKKEVT